MDQALVPAGGGGRRPNIGGVGAVVVLAMANNQFRQIPQAQPIFAHPPAHADAGSHINRVKTLERIGLLKDSFNSLVFGTFNNAPESSTLPVLYPTGAVKDT